MHYCCLVITKEFPTDDILESVLRPFNSEDFYSSKTSSTLPEFTWDWYSVGGRYAGAIQICVREHDPKYRWEFIERTPRNGRLFRASILDDLSNQGRDLWYYEGHYFGYTGMNDGVLYVDAAMSDDINNLSELGCYCFVDQDGRAFSREYFTGEELIVNQDFESQLSNAKANSSGCYICVVDLHD